MVSFEMLVREFENYFVKKYGYAIGSNKFGHGEGWVYAIVPGQDKWFLHYELIKRGGSTFVELHVESKITKELKEGLVSVFANHTRRYSHSTYYSNQYWMTRNPVVCEKNVSDDLDELCGVVQPVLGMSVGDVSSIDEENAAYVAEGDEYEEMTLEEVARRLRADCENRLIIPGVQRGRVWNAARMAALWDSLMRGFPVGAFSVRRVKSNAEGSDGQQRVDFELLDGQQRANAIALGFREFPPSPDYVDVEEAKVLSDIENSAQDECAKRIAYETPILWLDLNGESSIKGTEKKYAFFVSTVSQPWGYDFSEDETKNALLSTSERRASTEGIHYHQENDYESGKPYPCELYPVKAKLPIPFSLLRKYVWEHPDLKTVKVHDFCAWAKSSCVSVADDGDVNYENWIDNVLSAINDDCEVSVDIISAIRAIRKCKIFCTDATNVEDRDIALYFTRIGKGGVKPSDEELAFSMLKSKLDADFRETIYALSREGMSSAARLAHIAIRCFVSARAEGSRTRFFGGNVLAEAMAIVADAERLMLFKRFMMSNDVNSFQELIRHVNGSVLGIGNEEESGFADWHLSRFCSASDGDVYLFLLLEAWDFARSDANVKLQRGVAALVSQNAYMADRCLRYIRNRDEADYATRIKLGLADGFKDSYRNNPMLPLPPDPKVFDFAGYDELLDFVGRGGRAVEELKKGYRNPNAYFTLLYACKGSLPRYAPLSEKWAEENCPWDYDHMLPRSWVDKLGNFEASDLCRALEDSIGNLSPLPYSINRRISDKTRLPSYPCPEGTDNDIVLQKQQALKIQSREVGNTNQEQFASVGPDGTKARKEFAKNVFNRFKRIYECWYEGIGLKELLSYDKIISDTPVARRADLMSNVLALLRCKGDGVYKPYGLRFDGHEEFFEGKNVRGYYSYAWVSVERDCGNYSISFTVNDAGTAVELGIRKSPGQVSCDENTREMLRNALDGKLPKGADFEESNKYWYAYSNVFHGVELTSLAPNRVVSEILRLDDLVSTLKSDEEKGNE